MGVGSERWGCGLREDVGRLLWRGRGLNVGVGGVRLWAGSGRRGRGLKKDVGVVCYGGGGAYDAGGGWAGPMGCQGGAYSKGRGFAGGGVACCLLPDLTPSCLELFNLRVGLLQEGVVGGPGGGVA